MFIIQITDCSFQKTIKENMDEAAFPKKKKQLANQFSIRNLQPTCPIIQYSVFSHTFVVLKAKKKHCKIQVSYISQK